MEEISKKLNSCQQPIKKWVRKKVLATEELIKQKTCELENLQQVKGEMDLWRRRILKVRYMGY